MRARSFMRSDLILHMWYAVGEASPQSSSGHLLTSTPNSASPAPKFRDPHFEFEYADAEKEQDRKKARRTDPVNQVLEELQGLTSLEDMGPKMFPRHLFHGLRTRQETVETVRRWLEEAWEFSQTHSHRDLAAQASFDLNLLAPSV